MMWILTSVRHRALAEMVLGGAPCLVGLAALTALWACTGPALAASHVALKLKAKAAAAAAADAGKPQLVGTYGDWLAYQAQSPKSKICYALAQPKDRAPATLKGAQAYIFISSRPGEHVRNEISVIMGVPLKEGSGDAKAEVGTTAFDLVTKGQNAWMKNAAQESQLIDVMKKHGRLMVKAPVVKGGVATDSYSLSGLAQALDRVTKDCP
jgi:invasion protein IalB